MGIVDSNAPDICIYTVVNIYKDISLNTADALITNPFCVGSLYNVKRGAYKLCYSTLDQPNWKFV